MELYKEQDEVQKEDQTKQFILEKEDFYGYNHAEPLILDSSYTNLYNSLITNEDVFFSERNLGINVSKKRLKESLKIWANLGIKLRDIDILDKKYSVKDGNFIITQEFLDAIYPASPLELPIKFVRKRNGKLNGEVDVLTLEDANGEKDKKAIIYKKIVVTRANNNYAICAYNHEITHTQCDTGGSCTSILDTETIPILMEQIFARKIDSSDKTLIRIRDMRLLHLASNLMEQFLLDLCYADKIESDTYIKSSLQGVELANIYLTGSLNTQQEMQDYIKKIFAEERTVQEMLNKYGVSLETIPKNVKRLRLGK